MFHDSSAKIYDDLLLVILEFGTFASDFVDFTCFLLSLLYVFFVSHYFDHDGFMHHRPTMHVLDAADISTALVRTHGDRVHKCRPTRCGRGEAGDFPQ